MFFKKNDLDPTAQGVIMNSYLSGLSPQELLSNIVSERVQMLQKVLSVAKPGHYGRKFIKNMENILVENTRLIYKPNAIYQPLFGDDGFAIEFLGKQRIAEAFMSYSEIRRSVLSLVPEGASLSLKKLCETHLDLLQERLKDFKECLIANQRVNNAYTYSD